MSGDAVRSEGAVVEPMVERYWTELGANGYAIVNACRGVVTTLSA